MFLEMFVSDDLMTIGDKMTDKRMTDMGCYHSFIKGNKIVLK